MESEVLFADNILKALSEKGEAKVDELVEITNLEREKVTSTLTYLVRRELVKRPVWITTIESNAPIPQGDYSLSKKGKEIIATGLSVIDIVRSELQGISQNINNTNIKGDQNQVAQATGDNSSIFQTQENNKVLILTRMIDEDEDLNDEQKKGLKEVIEKVVKLKEAGETTEKIYGWIKKGINICAKYSPYLFSLI